MDWKWWHQCLQCVQQDRDWMLPADRVPVLALVCREAPGILRFDQSHPLPATPRKANGW